MFSITMYYGINEFIILTSVTITKLEKMLFNLKNSATGWDEIIAMLLFYIYNILSKTLVFYTHAWINTVVKNIKEVNHIEKLSVLSFIRNQ